MSSVLNIIQSPGTERTTRRIDLGDYDASLRGAVFDVWVTPTRAHVAAFRAYLEWLRTVPAQRQQERDAIEDEGEREAFNLEMGEQLDREMYALLDAWLAETWVNIPAEDVPAIRERLQTAENVAPGTWDWLYNRTLQAINDYREGLTKN